MGLKQAVVLLSLFSCVNKPIKGIPRPEISLCFLAYTTYEHDEFICGKGTNRESEDFKVTSDKIVGVTDDDYVASEKYVNQLEMRIRSLERRCK